MSSSRLTTTSYAILGALSLRAWSAYDLTAYMRRSAIRSVWPRTESRLYAEPKNLVKHGLATATKEYTGQRSRTVYRITAAGRRALRKWLSEPPARHQMEDETMLKLALADQGTRDQALATIQADLEGMEDLMTELLPLARAATDGTGLFPERRHISALNGRYTLARLRARLDFLTRAFEWISEWEGTALDENKLAGVKGMASPEELEDMLEELRGFLEKIHAEPKRPSQH